MGIIIFNLYNQYPSTTTLSTEKFRIKFNNCHDCLILVLLGKFQEPEVLPPRASFQEMVILNKASKAHQRLVYTYPNLIQT